VLAFGGSFNHCLSLLSLGHGHAPRKSVVLGLEFFETGFGLGDLGAEFFLCLLGLSPGKSPRARIEGDCCIASAQLAEGGPHPAQFLLDRFAGGVRNGTMRIVGCDLIIGQGIDQEFLTGHS
jgi:hypothetical protein